MNPAVEATSRRSTLFAVMIALLAVVWIVSMLALMRPILSIGLSMWSNSYEDNPERSQELSIQQAHYCPYIWG
jgi:hypothetical protein